MTNITKAEELTSVRQVILECINEFITDPLTGQQTRKFNSHWIFEGFPNPANLGKAEPEEDRAVGESPGGWKFPIIVFDFPEPETENAVVDGSKQFIDSSITIECHARSRLVANQLAEQVKNILETTANSALSVATLHLDTTIAAPTVPDFIGGNKYYTKPIQYNFKRFD